MPQRRRDRTDAGPVPFSLRLESTPATVERPEVFDVGPGLIGDLAATYARGWRGRWTVHLGPARIELELPRDGMLLEELWVLLIELVDAEAGEWSLYDGDDELVLEMQVYGPDVNIELTTGGGGPPRFRGQRLPDRATVRLRALIAEGVAFFAQLVDDAARLDDTLTERDDLAGFRADLKALTEAVADLPGTFRK